MTDQGHIGFMPSSSESIVVERNSEDVFTYVADLRNEPSWHVDIASVPPETDPVPQVGRTYPVTFKPFMGKSDGSFTALEVVPGRKIVYQAELAGIRPVITYTVEPDGAGTRFTRAVDLKISGALVVMTPVMALMVPRRNKVFVANLKRILERGGS